MAKAQKHDIAIGPFDKAGKASGVMTGVIQPLSEGVDSPFEADGVYRDTRGDTLYAHAWMRRPPAADRAIYFALDNKDAPSGTYAFPGNQVKFLGLILREHFQDKLYGAISGEIKLENHQPEQRISGSLRFTTETIDGHSFRVVIDHFDIRGMD